MSKQRSRRTAHQRPQNHPKAHLVFILSSGARLSQAPQRLTTAIQNPSYFPLLPSEGDKRARAPRRLGTAQLRGARSIPELREFPGGCGTCSAAAEQPPGPESSERDTSPRDQTRQRARAFSPSRPSSPPSSAGPGNDSAVPPGSAARRWGTHSAAKGTGRWGPGREEVTGQGKARKKRRGAQNSPGLGFFLPLHDHKTRREPGAGQRRWEEAAAPGRRTPGIAGLGAAAPARRAGCGPRS